MANDEYEVIANVSPRSVGAATLFSEQEPITKENVDNFRSTTSDVRDATRVLEDAGFKVFTEASSDITLSVGGSAKLFREFFGAKITRQKADIGPDTTMTFMGTSDEPEEALMQAPDQYHDLLEGAVIARPPQYFAESAIPPVAQVDPGAYQYLTVPDGVSVIMRSARVHRLGVTGKDVVVGMIDTGLYRHPFYLERGYRLLATLLGPGASDAATDPNGHGTGEAANIFANAPDCRLRMVKAGNDPVGSFNVLLNSTPKPQVSTNSWGYNVDHGGPIPNWLKPLEAAIANAVAAGVTVCFSAGNGHKAFPGSHPDVISVGGVHVNLPDITDFEASSYASSFVSGFYPGRKCPDVCGLTGKKVNIGGAKAPSLLLPVQEGASLDSITPTTGSNTDGYGLFSGTSAACPQVAGIVALMLEKNPALTPAQVKDKLVKSARDVKKGTTNNGDTAAVGPDLATGTGLADAKWAYLNTMGDVATAFFAAPKEQQMSMVSSGAMPEISKDFVEDLIDTLRSR